MPTKPRILVIDDNPAIHEDFDKILAPEINARVDSIRSAEALLFGAPASGSFPAPSSSAKPEFALSHASQGQDGLRMVQESLAAADPFAVAFVDMRMPPGWDGLETAERIIAADPNIQIVICTAYSDHSWEEIRNRLQITDGLLILKKPFDVVEVLQIAHNLCRKWQLTQEHRTTLRELDQRVEARTAEARAGHERFAAMFQSAPLAQFIIDSQGTMEANEAACHLTGIDQESWLMSSSAANARSTTGLEGLIGMEHPLKDAEAMIRNAAGEEKHILASSVALGLSGSPALLLMIQDFTERRRLEGDLRQMQKMDAVGQLAAGIAHDFNNLLTVIGGNARLISESVACDTAFDEALVDEILEASTRAADMTRKLLAFTRRHVFLPVSLDLNTLIEKQVSILARLLGETVQIRWLPGPSGIIMADAASLEQVILNLAVNARDAMPGGGQIVLSTGISTVSTSEEAKRIGVSQGHYAWFSCMDTGTGMPPQVAERVFEPFFTTKDIGKGTGLGLSSVYGTIKRHGGGTHLQTAVGDGTTVSIYLPLERAKLPAIPAPPPVVEAPANKNRLTVLMVEDEPAVRRIGIRLLASLGHEAIEAIDGHDGLAKWRERRSDIDLIITDMVMPGGMSGLGIATTVQSEDPNLPVILSSGYSSELIDEEGVGLPPNLRFLPKPYSQETLRNAIESLGCVLPA